LGRVVSGQVDELDGHDPAFLGFSTELACLGRQVKPIRLGSRVSSAHMGRRARFQIYHELKT